MGWGCQPHVQTPTWRTRVSLFVWIITFDLSGIVGLPVVVGEGGLVDLKLHKLEGIS
jgi:hypothetical protein